MTIYLKKFGTVLTSRQAGKEAYAAFLPTLMRLNEKEPLLLDFDGVSTFSPSWGDEFLTPLQKKFWGRLTLKNVSNPSVSLTITTLERINGGKFKIVFRNFKSAGVRSMKKSFRRPGAQAKTLIKESSQGNEAV